MLKNLKDLKTTLDVMLTLLPTSGTLAGIAIGLVGVINARPKGGIATWADEILLVVALGFLVDCYLIFFAMRSTEKPHFRHLLHVIDGLFLLSLTLMVFSGFAVVYEFI